MIEATYEVICLDKNANTNHFGHLYLEQEKARKLLGKSVLKNIKIFKKIITVEKVNFLNPQVGYLLTPNKAEQSRPLGSDLGSSCC